MEMRVHNCKEFKVMYFGCLEIGLKNHFVNFFKDSYRFEIFVILQKM